MKEIIGYKFNTEQAAKNAAKSLKAHFLTGRPTPDAKGYITQEYVNPRYDKQGFWWFSGDYAPVLGSPDTFNIDTSID